MVKPRGEHDKTMITLLIDGVANYKEFVMSIKKTSQLVPT